MIKTNKHGARPYIIALNINIALEFWMGVLVVVGVARIRHQRNGNNSGTEILFLDQF